MNDPVCGMALEGPSEHEAEFCGQRYAFCSSACRQQFEREPELYATAKPKTPGDVPARAMGW